MSRESQMREYAKQAETTLREMAKRICDNCPELMGWEDKNILQDHLSDAFGDIFPGLISQAKDADERNNSERFAYA